MRPIKFRGYSLYSNNWVFGDLIHHFLDEETCYSILPQELDTWLGANKVAAQSVGQFTGLHDKNGKEIYEGDVVNVTNKGAYNGLRAVVWDSNILCYVLVWIECYKDWNGANAGTTYLKLSIGVRCEKEGDVYTNPELVDGKSFSNT